MSKFNPDFWEVTIASESWERFSEADRLWYERPEEAAVRQERFHRARALRPEIEQLLREVLTDKQREVVLLHFLEELNQRQIAERLAISQQSVSEHLYGKLRNGHAVGGALRKLRNACLERNLRWEIIG